MKTRLSLVAAATLMAVAHGASAAPTAAGTQITNKATATYTDSTGTKTAESNTVITTVQQVASVALSAGTAKNAAAGGTVAYAHTVTNTGNGADTFTLSQTNTGTAAVTGVQFFLDANGDGVADNATPITSTGSLPVGGTFKFVAVATLTAGSATGSTNAMTVKATSAFNAGGSGSASAVDTTTISAGAVMDITANGPGTGAQGAGPGAEASAVDVKTTTAGVMTSFTMYLNNAGGTQDTFNLSASTDGTFGTTVLPSGWTVVFKDASGAVITSATVAAGGNVKVTAEVTPVAGTAPGTTDIFFRALSPTSGVQDKIHNAVTVAAANSLFELVKTQALDANCDGVADTAFSSAPITSGAVPGACIRYTIVGTNKGATTINAVVIRDDIPAHTTYHSGSQSSVLGNLLAPLVGGLVTYVEASGYGLTPGQSNTMVFGVKIDQ